MSTAYSANLDALKAMKAGDLDRAADLYRVAVATFPHSHTLLNNYPEVLVKQGRFDECIDFCTATIAAEPGLFSIHNALGKAYWGRGDFTEAAEHFILADKLVPDFAAPRFNLGVLALMQEDYDFGWRGYDWRFAGQGAWMRYGPQSLWKGEDAAMMVVWGEQGLGDEIMHASMARDFAKRFTIPIDWECDERLVSLFRRSLPEINFVPRTTLPLYSLSAYRHLPAGSIGRYERASIEAFPTTAGYLTALPTQEVLAPRGKARIGISWHSSNATYGRQKSATLADFALLQAALPDCTFVDLQYPASYIGMFPPTPNWLQCTGVDLKQDIEGVASLIASCDLVVCVSTAVAHLAGALGKEAFVLVSDEGFKPWYWGHGTRTPWYPSIEIFRRARGEPWATVVARAVQRIQECLE